MTWAASRSDWRRRRRGCAPPGGTSTSVDAAKEKLRRGDIVDGGSDRLSSADAHGDAARGAGDRRRRAASTPSARSCAYGLYAPLNAEWLRSIGVDAIFGGEFEQELTEWAGLKACATADVEMDRAVTSVAQPLQGCQRRCRASISSSPIAPGCRRCRVMRRCSSRRHRDVWSATPRRAAAASTCAGTVRSCRSTTASSASCSPTSCWPISARRSPPAREHITLRRSGFLQRPDARDAHRRRAACRTSGGHLRRHDQGGAPARASRSPAAACARPAARSSRAPSNRWTIACWRCSTKGTRAPISSRRSRRAARAGVTLMPTFVAFHPWLTLERYCDLLDTIEDTRSRRPRGADSARHPAADSGGIAAAGARRDAAPRRRLRSGDADAIAGRIPIPASTNCTPPWPRSSAPG